MSVTPVPNPEEVLVELAVRANSDLPPTGYDRDLVQRAAAALRTALADKAEAWDEGYDRAESDGNGAGYWTKRLRDNPYREATS